MADMMMNRGIFKWTFKDRIKSLFIPDNIIQYLKSLRWSCYIANKQQYTPPSRTHSKKHLPPYIKFIGLYHKIRCHRLGLKLGFSIGSEVFGYGLVIPHYGTIVVGNTNRIGNYAVLHTSTCISNNGKVIGDALYLATGVKITSKVKLGDNVSVGANSVVNKSFGSNIMIGGSPAKQIKEAEAWYIRDGETYLKRMQAVEELKRKMNI